MNGSRKKPYDGRWFSPRVICASSVVVAVCSCGVVPTVHAQPFPPAGDDQFRSVGVFKVTIGPALGGASFVVWVADPNTVVLRSGAHFDAGVAGDVSGLLGSGLSPCMMDPQMPTSDMDIGYHPPGYEGGSVNEVHTEICRLNMTGWGGWGIRAGEAAFLQTNRSLGEVESRALGGTGFPADSFFNLFVEVDVPPGAGGTMTLCNIEPLTVQERGIAAFPPAGNSYTHSFSQVGKTILVDCATGCFVGWLEQGSHGVLGPGCLEEPGVVFPVVFSVDALAEGLRVPDPCAPWGHPEPNDVYALGFAGLANVPPSQGFATEGELFQASGLWLGAMPDITNVDRLSGALGIGPPPGGPPFTGPFAPNTGAPIPAPNPPVGPGTLIPFPRLVIAEPSSPQELGEARL